MILLYFSFTYVTRVDYFFFVEIIMNILKWLREILMFGLML